MYQMEQVLLFLKHLSLTLESQALDVEAWRAASDWSCSTHGSSSMRPWDITVNKGIGVMYCVVLLEWSMWSYKTFRRLKAS